MPKAQVLLRTALTARSGLRALVVAGIGAVEARHRHLIDAAEKTKIGDSLDLDAAGRAEFPQANRWDYLLSVPIHSHIVGVEPHSAKDSEITAVIAKKTHAVEYLRERLPAKHRVARWFWVSTGSVGFGRMDRARRRLDQNGITFVGRLLRSLA